jgi:phosphopantothenoylcysteine decarboxylase/phosphopantothenate--cysteine ligase
MARILITSGPTRQYLDPVRYLTNASSGRMGSALAQAAIDAGHEVVIVSGPVDARYPSAAQVIPVVSTEDMLAACLQVFADCDGVIGAAAPCDYRPLEVASQKLAKNGKPLSLQLVETPDIIARLGTLKTRQWIVAFALETGDPHLRALQKLEQKNCDLIVLNGPTAINAIDTQVEILNRTGKIVATLSGSKLHVAQGILRAIHEQLIL